LALETEIGAEYPKGAKTKVKTSIIQRAAPWAGLIGTVIFTLSFTLNGIFTPDYDPVQRYVSELSLGPHGWIQIVNFMFLGVCLMVFAFGVSRSFPSGKASRAGPALLIIIAACYFISGPLVTDPLSMFDNQQSVSGILHGIFGALVFALSPVCCFVFWRRFRADPDWKRMQTWTFVAGIVMAIIVVLMKIAQPHSSALNEWAGLIQRCSLLTFYAWVFAFSLGLRKSKPASKISN